MLDNQSSTCSSEKSILRGQIQAPPFILRSRQSNLVFKLTTENRWQKGSYSSRLGTKGLLNCYHYLTNLPQGEIETAAKIGAVSSHCSCCLLLFWGPASVASYTLITIDCCQFYTDAGRCCKSFMMLVLRLLLRSYGTMFIYCKKSITHRT